MSSPAHKADGDERPGVRPPGRTRSAVYTAGPCALEGSFRTGRAHCQERRGGAVRTGGVVPEGVCAVPAATSVQTPFRTRLPVRKADGDEKPGAQTPGRTRSAVHTPRPCALEGPFRRDFAQCRRLPVYKPPSGQGRQCAKPATTNSRAYTPPPKRGPQCTQPGRAHWRGRSGRAGAVPGRRGGAVRTGGVVPEGVCAVPAATSVQTPFRTTSPVRTASDDEWPSVHTPAETRSAVYTAGPCALGWTFRRDFCAVPKVTWWARRRVLASAM